MRLGEVNPSELAVDKGLASEASERRMRLACRQPVATGLAREKEHDMFVLALHNIRVIAKMCRARGS
ncbi:hypothetical protein V3F56_03170 [Moorellaceae bacterium AZ2]